LHHKVGKPQTERQKRITSFKNRKENNPVRAQRLSATRKRMVQENDPGEVRRREAVIAFNNSPGKREQVSAMMKKRMADPAYVMKVRMARWAKKYQPPV